MPLTFPSHAAAVLPLKVWRPRWFDGVALVIGSASPDLAYALDGSGWPVFPLSHQWLGVFLFCLPVTLLACWPVRRSAPVVALHLPGWWRDYGVLGTYRPRLVVTATSAALGAASHVAWDRMAVGHLDPASTITGAVIAVALLLHIGRSGKLVAWHGPVPVGRANHARFWTVAALVTISGCVIALQLPGAFLAHTTGARVVIAFAVGLVVAAAVTKTQGP